MAEPSRALALLERSFEFNRIRAWAWFAPALPLTPAIGVLNVGLLQVTGTPVPHPRIAILPTLVVCAFFFVGALGEELDWSGYAIEPMQDR